MGFIGFGVLIFFLGVGVKLGFLKVKLDTFGVWGAREF